MKTYPVYLWIDPVESYPLILNLKHTAICVHETVFSFSTEGLTISMENSTKVPKEIQRIGYTKKTLEEVQQNALMLHRKLFNDYDLETANCNHYADELCIALTNTGIPTELLDQGKKAKFLPESVKKSTGSGSTGFRSRSYTSKSSKQERENSCSIL